MDGKNPENAFEIWRQNLPPFFQFNDFDTTYDHIYPNILLQRCMLAVYYLSMRLMFRRARLLSRSKVGQEERRKTKFSQVATLAIELLEWLKLYRGQLTAKRRRQTCFLSTFFVLEAAVTLIIARNFDAKNPSATEWENLVEESIVSLEKRQGEDNGTIVQQSVQALRALRSTSLARDESVANPVNGRSYTTGDETAEGNPEMRNVEDSFGLSGDVWQYIQAPLYGWQLGESDMRMQF